MKKLRVLLTVCVLAFAMLALTSCGGTLEAPSGFSFNEETQTLSWEKVEGAIGYSVIVGEKEKSTKSNSFTVSITEQGVYDIQVKALGDGKSMKDSGYAVYKYEKDESETGLKYELINNNTEYRLVSIGSASGDVVMEETFRGKDVTAIASGALANNGKITSFTFNSKVTEIPEKAFYNCNALENVVIPENIVKIAPRAFQSCRKLNKVSLPSGVTVIEEYAFSYCRELKEVTLSPDTTVVGPYAFSDCSKLTKINIPDKVTNIGEYAFSGCKEATELYIGKNVEYIGDYAFYYCQLVDEIDIPDGVTYIGDSAFESCIKISTVTLPDVLTTLGDRAFAFCESLAEINVGDNLESVGINVLLDTPYYNDYEDGEGEIVYLGNWIIACKNPEIQKGKDLIVKDGVVGIAANAFRGCNGFVGVTLNDIKYIGDFAFYDCASLGSVLLGENAVYIGDYAFTMCKKLTQLPYLANTKIEYIGDFAFNGCERLTTVTLPKTVELIGTQAFNNTNISAIGGILYVGNWVVGTTGNFFMGDQIRIRDGVVGIAEYSFNQCMFMGELVLPSTVERICRGAFLLCMNLRIEEFPESLKRIDDYAFYGCSNALFGVENGPMDYHLTLPDGLEYIGRSAFYQTSLLGLTIPGSCKYIGEFAFFGCSLLGSLGEYEIKDDESDSSDDTDGSEGTDPGYSDSNILKVRYHLILEEGIEEIGSRAFFGCSGLIDLTIPDSVTTLGIRAFYKCEALKTAVIGTGFTEVPAYTFYGCKSLEDVTFSDTIKTIDKYAFRGCEKLSELNLPKSLKEIGTYAFHGCNAIKSLSLPAGVISVGDFAFRKNLSLTTVVLHSGIVDLGQHALYMDNAATIYCENESRPDYWNARWNSSYRPVIWGCTLSADKDYVVSFVKNENTIENSDAINGILAPAREGYEFDGWSLEDGGAVAFSASDIVNAENGTTLYAIWRPISAE